MSILFEAGAYAYATKQLVDSSQNLKVLAATAFTLFVNIEYVGYISALVRNEPV